MICLLLSEFFCLLTAKIFDDWNLSLFSELVLSCENFFAFDLLVKYA